MTLPERVVFELLKNVPNYTGDITLAIKSQRYEAIRTAVEKAVKFHRDELLPPKPSKDELYFMLKQELAGKTVSEILTFIKEKIVTDDS